jgi:DNA-binding NtrC family response regulator
MKQNEEECSMPKAIMVITPLNTLRSSLESLLQQTGYVICPGIRTISAFRHALDASETPPNVILLDYWLGRSMTSDFIYNLKKQGFTVILMGTKFLGKDVAESTHVQFLEKPFNQIQLVKAIRSARR